MLLLAILGATRTAELAHLLRLRDEPASQRAHPDRARAHPPSNRIRSAECINAIRRMLTGSDDGNCGLAGFASGTGSVTITRQLYLQRSASVGFSRYLSWQFEQAVVIVSAASRILSISFDCAALYAFRPASRNP